MKLDYVFNTGYFVTRNPGWYRKKKLLLFFDDFWKRIGYIRNASGLAAFLVKKFTVYGSVSLVTNFLTKGVHNLIIVRALLF